MTSEPFNTLVASRYGPMLVNRHDVYVGGSLLAYGEYSQGEVDLLTTLLKPGMVAVVAGAHCGAIAIPLAKHLAPGLLFAFEPQRTLCDTVIANAALNSLVNVRAMHAALGAQRGTVAVPFLDPNASQNFGGLSLPEHPTGEHVGVYALDDFQFQRLHLLMADVEGMEADVLRGAMQTIERCLPMLYIEADREAKRPEVLQLLTELGYAAYWHMPPLYNPNNFFRCAENIFPNVVSINWLAVPEERDMHPSWVRVTLDQIQPAATEAP